MRKRDLDVTQAGEYEPDFIPMPRLSRRAIYLATQMRITFRATSLLCAQWIDRCTGEIFLGKLA